MFNIVIDENIPGVAETFAQHGQIFRLNGRQMTRNDLKAADALIVRSVTTVDASLLGNSPVRFVGTATIGVDHLDVPWLEAQGIRWASAPGCNANAAAQYTVAMMLLACQRAGIELRSSCIGILGLGNVGSRVRDLLTSLGVSQFRLYDPPLADLGTPDLSPAEELFDCNILSLHVPLSAVGPHPTYKMINQDFLASLKTGSLLLNCSRGSVIDGNALLEWLKSSAGHAALDVFPEEPHIDPSLIDALTVASPHVAGYSLDGKCTGTEMIYRSFCQSMDLLPRASDLTSRLPIHELPRGAASSLDSAILTACPVQRDDKALRDICIEDPAKQARLFDCLRKEYPDRRDFAGWSIPHGLKVIQENALRALGFR